MNRFVTFTTITGTKYTVDLTGREFQNSLTPETVKFETVARLFAGSPGATFYDAHGSEFFTTAEIESVENCPSEDAVGDSNNPNVTFLTNNSSYEVNQEEKLIRRLAGTNHPCYAEHQDGEWVPYERIEYVAVGHRAFIKFDANRDITTSTIRAVIGVFVGAPESREVVVVEYDLP